MRNRSKICLYVFLICAFFALGILGYFVFNDPAEETMMGKKFMTINNVDGASYYTLNVDDSNLHYNVQQFETENPDITQFEIEIFDGDEKIAVETYSRKTINKIDSNKIDCTIQNYTINFFNTDKTFTLKSENLYGINKNSFCTMVSKFLPEVFDWDGEYNIVCLAENIDGDVIDTREYSYSYHACEKEDFLSRGEFFYYGKWYDFVIDSKDELSALVGWTILYRQADDQDLTFYVNTQAVNVGNVNKIVWDAINNYPEYDALRYNTVYAKMNGNLGRLVDFNYYLNENFDKPYTALTKLRGFKEKYYYGETNGIIKTLGALDYLRENDATFDGAYITNTPQEREFVIDALIGGNKARGVPVFNTEQLYMVVQSGEVPIFEDGESVVKTVYENTKNVLRQINNSNLLSDYEKAYNIYNYICGEVMYDDVIYQYMRLANNFDVEKFGNFSCFYLEGVFLNFEGVSGHYAVCDGLSKAYSLLCNMEGIPCVKINGKTGPSEYHAWNKVYLADENYNLDGWYYVDTTWGEGTFTENSKKHQTCTHTYFLIDADKLDDREILFPTALETYENGEDFDYYKSTTFGEDEAEFDLYIDSNKEMKNAFVYVQENLLTTKGVLEVKFDNAYWNAENSFITLLNNCETQNQLRAVYSVFGVDTSIQWVVLDSAEKVIIFKLG